ncbi:hypothetical protein ACJRO7_031722 [Eucalyptus globulus]|uniref:F-box domain-containing protein n=1 Tax=Eucalyptus globulus TaxID=34317 RepID=A0ABD3JHM4_EUCGL
MAESVPEDIIVDILLRLPAKSSVRFKRIYKRWRSLISDSSFANQKIITCGHNRPLETVDYEALDGGGEGCAVVPHAIKYLGKPCFVGFCDGLICLIGFRSFVIYNPTTREYIELPGPGFINQDELFYGFGNESFCGFGYDSQSDDYKIVAADVLSDENWKVAIFSLKSGSWRRMEVQFQEGKVELSSQGVYWKGAFHWHAYVWTIGDPCKDVIVI